MKTFANTFLLVAMSLSVVFGSSSGTAAQQNTCRALFSGEVQTAPLADKTHEQLSQVSKKSPLAPKPLMVRVVSNIYRWYLKGDARAKKDQAYDFLDDYDFIREKRLQDKLGVVRSFFSHKYDTRIYYTATGVPDASGRIPVVNPKAKGLYIYVHGSGTSKGGGANFSYKMNKLAPLGYAALSFDLPFHSEGSRSRDMLNADKFYAMMREMIKEYRVPGMPVYLAGHSFGPDVIAEFVKRYPFDVDGIAMISPGAFNKDLEQWFMKHTSYMTALWGDMVTNDDGSAWSGVLNSQHKWRKPPTTSSPDPTVVNPNLKVRIISGAWEEYVPGKLDYRGLPTKTARDYNICKALLSLLSKATCHIEPGVGHYIFEHKDASGQDVILRELLALDGESLDHEKQLKDAALLANKGTDSQEFARKFIREAAFRQYIVENFNGKETIQELLRTDDQKLARKMIQDYVRFVTTQRDRALVENLKNTQKWNPRFYANNRTEIDGLDLAKPRPTDALLNKYFDLIEQLPVEDRAIYAHVSAEVYKVPERQAPPVDIRDQRERKQKDKGNKGAAAQSEEKAS